MSTMHEPLDASLKTAPIPARAGRNRRGLSILIALVLGAMVLAGVFVLRLGRGEIVVEGPSKGPLPQDISVVLSGGGRQLEISSASQWKLSVLPGTYVVEIKGGQDTFEIQEHEIQVKRSGTQIIKVTRKDAQTAQTKQPRSVARPASWAGRWTISKAENLEGESYGGTVQMRALPSGVVELDWLDEQGHILQTGIGMVRDGHLFAAWGAATPFGFCLYQRLSDGSMEASWTVTGAEGCVSSEQASGGMPGVMEGAYKIEGTALGAQTGYAGALSVMRMGEAFAVDWTLPEGTYQGVGLRHKNYLAIGWSTGQTPACGVVHYHMEEDTARGRWVMLGQNRLSFEILKRDTASSQPKN